MPALLDKAPPEVRLTPPAAPAIEPVAVHSPAAADSLSPPAEASADTAGDRLAFVVWKCGVLAMAALLLWDLIRALIRLR
jgi:hypothetical protein